MNVREATDFIIASESPARWLTLLDMYIHQYNQIPAAFVLPREYEVLLPLIQVLARAHKKLPEYIRNVRDELPKDVRRDGVNALYRTVMTRYLQQDRRARVSRAVDKAITLWGPLTREQRVRYESKLYTLWGRRRQELLANHGA